MANTAPPFDPNKPFTKVAGPAAPKAPAFDPSKPFTKSGVPNAAQGAAVVASPPAAAPASQSDLTGMIGAAKEKLKSYGMRSGVSSQAPSFDEFMDGAQSWARGISLGTSDNAEAGLAAAILKAKGDPRAMYDIYSQLDDQVNASIEESQNQHPGLKAAELTGSFMTPGLRGIGGWISRGTNWARRTGRAIASGATMGGIGGAGYAKPGEEVSGAEHGAKVGALAGPLVQGAGELLAPTGTAANRLLSQLGIRQTWGQMLGGAGKATEEKAQSIPGLGDVIKNASRVGVEDLNRATYNAALAPLGMTVPRNFPVGNEGFAHVDDIISAQYDHLLPQLTFRPDQQFVTDMGAVTQAVAALPQEQQRAFAALMDREIAGKLDPHTMSMDGDTFKGAESEIGRQARGLASDPSWNQRELGSAVRQALMAVRQGLERSNPQFQAQLQPINQAYSTLLRIQDATSKLGAKDGVFTGAQLLNAVKGMATSKKQFARGEAPLQPLAMAAKQVQGNNYPDSGTAGRALIGAGLVGGAHMVSPGTAVGLAASTIPYLPGVRNYWGSPFSQDVNRMLMQAAPVAAGQAPRYIGQQ